MSRPPEVTEKEIIDAGMLLKAVGTIQILAPLEAS